ncbi:acetyltransferase [Nostoc sp. CHAB 5784]|uniref:acetyltransferase n=1 Tax=Nostoc mirabile TaxID=2907820 RepID=UPI001E36FF38|nr:acetyltransferase [Nostoc mirabile]MCC5667727.1 acetyltransferase [Nostoc mirabile CHAB5784]
MSKQLKQLMSAITLMGFISPFVGATQTNAATGPSFVDPTATLNNPQNITIGSLTYVAPFASLKAGTQPRTSINIGNESNVQDNVVVDASTGAINIGDQVILAHNSTVKGSASLGKTGICPGGVAECPSFVSFNAVVDGAIIEKDAMVLALARVAPGVTIPSGLKVLPGKYVASQAEVRSKTARIVAADRKFMSGVIEVNKAFAVQYTQLKNEDPSNVTGINYDPGNTTFNRFRDLPTFAGQSTRDPAFRNRIIGDVQFTQNLNDAKALMSNKISLRADEGEPFVVGNNNVIKDNVTFHALEHTELQIGSNNVHHINAVIHGGPTSFSGANDTTITGDNFVLKDRAVFFRSRIGNNSVVGTKSLVQESDLAAGSVVPDKTIVIGNAIAGSVEW